MVDEKEGLFVLSSLYPKIGDNWKSQTIFLFEMDEWCLNESLRVSKSFIYLSLRYRILQQLYKSWKKEIRWNLRLFEKL